MPLYPMNSRGIMQKALFCIKYEGCLTLKMTKMVLNPFCDETLHFIPTPYLPD